jgi:hypothetical protein
MKVGMFFSRMSALALGLTIFGASPLSGHPLDEPMPVGYFVGTKGQEKIVVRLSIGGRGLIGEWRRPGEEFPATLDGEFVAGNFRLEERATAAEVTGTWRGVVSRQGQVLTGFWLPPAVADATMPGAEPFQLQRLATFTELAVNDAEEVRASTTVPRFTCTHLPGWDRLNRMLLSELPLEQMDFLALHAARLPPKEGQIAIPPECETWVQMGSVSRDHISLMARTYRYDGGASGIHRLQAINLKREESAWKPLPLSEVVAQRKLAWESFQTMATEAFVNRHAAVVSGQGKALTIDWEQVESIFDEKGFTCYTTNCRNPQTGEILSFRVELPDPNPAPIPELPPEEPVPDQVYEEMVE